MAVPVEIKILDERIISEFGVPTYGTVGSAGLDLRACIDEPEVVIPAGGQLLVGTGLAIHLKNVNLAGLAIPRSGLGSKHGIILGNTIGLIDSDYQGEIKLCLLNRSDKDFVLKAGERIAQYMVVPTFQLHMTVVDEFSDLSQRGDGGFGSTGSK